MLLMRSWLCLKREELSPSLWKVQQFKGMMTFGVLFFFSFHFGKGALPAPGILRTCQRMSTFPVFRNKRICLVLYLSTTVISAANGLNIKGPCTIFGTNCTYFLFKNIFLIRNRLTPISLWKSCLQVMMYFNNYELYLKLLTIKLESPYLTTSL